MTFRTARKIVKRGIRQGPQAYRGHTWKKAITRIWQTAYFPQFRAFASSYLNLWYPFPPGFSPFATPDYFPKDQPHLPHVEKDVT